MMLPEVPSAAGSILANTALNLRQLQSLLEVEECCIPATIQPISGGHTDTGRSKSCRCVVFRFFSDWYLRIMGPLLTERKRAHSTDDARKWNVNTCLTFRRIYQAASVFHPFFDVQVLDDCVFHHSSACLTASLRANTCLLFNSNTD